MRVLLVLSSVLLATFVASQEPCATHGKPGVCQAQSSPCKGESFPHYCRDSDTRTCCVASGNPNCDFDPASKSKANVEITGISAYFDNTVGANLRYCGDPGTGNDPNARPCKQGENGEIDNGYASSQIRWGTNAKKDLGFVTRSGLGFTKMSPRKIDLFTPFKLGTFYHFNFPIWSKPGPIPESSRLNIEIEIASAAKVKFSYVLGLDETPNVESATYKCPFYPPGLTDAEKKDVEPCPDKVYLAAGGLTPTKFSIPGQPNEYTLEVVGFKSDVCKANGTIQGWVTQEEVINEAMLVGRISQACPTEDQCPPDHLVYKDGSCICGGASVINGPPIPPTPAGNVISGIEQESGTGDTKSIVGGLVMGVVGMFLIAVIAFLSYNKVTTGSWLGRKQFSYAAISQNPLYEDNDQTQSNPLYEGK